MYVYMYVYVYVYVYNKFVGLGPPSLHFTQTYGKRAPYPPRIPDCPKPSCVNTMIKPY